jgi:hypothetical protein
MGSLIAADKRTARKKGFRTAAVAGGAAVLFIVNPFLGIAGLAGAAYLGYDWFMYRAKRGMRF